MNQSTFTQLTGRTLTSSQGTRFATVAEVSGELLEELLGWPLCPDDWDDQYLEIGKTSSDYAGNDVDLDDLEDPDDVVGTTRLFPWNPSDPYLAIDPAVVIHAVKLVKDSVTYKTFETSEFRVDWLNGKERFAKYVQLCDGISCNCWWHTWCYRQDCRQIAVDADWAFDDLPLPLKKAWAELIWDDLDCKKNVRSETIGPHSYTLFAKEDPAVRYRSALVKYAGPNGSICQMPAVA